jgi:hypothetical protein
LAAACLCELLPRIIIRAKKLQHVLRTRNGLPCPAMQVPPELLGFRHVTEGVALQAGSCVVWPASRCLNDGLLPGTCKVSASDHLMDGYFGNLRACVDRQQLLSDCGERQLPLWTEKVDIP